MRAVSLACLVATVCTYAIFSWVCLALDILYASILYRIYQKFSIFWCTDIWLYLKSDRRTGHSSTTIYRYYYYHSSYRIRYTSRQDKQAIEQSDKHKINTLPVLENVAINDVLSLKGARRDATANLNCVLGPGDTSHLITMVSFTFDMRRHLIRLAAVPFTSYRLAKFGWVPFADLRVRSLAVK